MLTLLPLLLGGPIGCSRGLPADTDTDTDSDTDTDVDTDSDPPGACPLDIDICPSNAVPVAGEGTYTRVDGGGFFCLSPLTLDQACDEYIPSYPGPGCPPFDWDGFASWRKTDAPGSGRPFVNYSREFRMDGDLVALWFLYEDELPTLMFLDRYCSEALWCCDDGQGGTAVQLLFGDASLAYPCTLELPP